MKSYQGFRDGQTKAERVIEALERAGKQGIHSFDIIKYGGLRASARVGELRKDGYNIKSVHERKGDCYGVRYFLVQD